MYVLFKINEKINPTINISVPVKKTYYGLTKEQYQSIYKAIYEAERNGYIVEPLKNAVPENITEQELNQPMTKIIDDVETEYGQYSYLPHFEYKVDGGKLEINISYNMINNKSGKNYTPEEVAALMAEAEKFANKEIKKIIDEDMSEKDKAKAIHDYLVKNLIYDDVAKENKLVNIENGTPYGAFKNKKVVCDGYSKTYQLLLSKANIKSKYMEGKAIKTTKEGVVQELGPHSWNLVSINNKWEFVDVTWDKKFLVFVCRKYFCMPIEKFQRDHSRNKERYDFNVL